MRRVSLLHWEKRNAHRKILAANFPRCIFTRRVFSLITRASCIAYFFEVNCSVQYCEFLALHRIFSVSLPFSFLGVSAPFVAQIFSSQILSHHALFHLTYLSLHFFPPPRNIFFFLSWIFSLFPRLFSMFSHARWLLYVLFSSSAILHHSFSRRPFSSRKFLLFLYRVSFLSEAISVANLFLGIRPS